MQNTCFVPQGLPFRDRKSIHKSCFPRHYPGRSLFGYCILIWYESCRFGDPFKIQWASKLDQNSTVQHCQQISWRIPALEFLFVTCFFKALWVSSLCIVDRCWLSFALLFDRLQTQFDFPLGTFWKGVAVKFESCGNESAEFQRDNNWRMNNLYTQTHAYNNIYANDI